MSLLDDVMNAAAATSNAPASHPELELVQQLLSHHGGVGGLADAFTRGGLGAQVQSWIGNGANLPISGPQLAALIGSGQLGALVSQCAGRLGIGQDEMMHRVAAVLPHAIDHLTPNGCADPGGAFDMNALGGVIGRLGGLFGAR